MKTAPFTLWAGPASPVAMELFPGGYRYVLLPGIAMDDSRALLEAWYDPFPGSIGHRSYQVRTYDDSWGSLYISRNSTGINGICRASGGCAAWEICEDEFFPEADETVEELRKEYNVKRKTVKIVRDPGGPERDAVYPDDYPEGTLKPEFVRWETRETPVEEGEEDVWMENELFTEAYGFRPNGPREGDVHKHGIYSRDLNGDSLEELTPELRERLNILLYVENEKERLYPYFREDYLGNTFPCHPYEIARHED